MLKEIAQEANKIEDELWLNIDAVLHKLTQEMWEVNDVIQKYRWIYCKSRKEIIDIESEVWDLVFNLISILNRLWIDPDRIWDFAKTTLNKFYERKDLYKSNQW